MWDHFLSRHWTQISPDFPLQAFVGYAHAQVATILPDSPPRFVIALEAAHIRWKQHHGPCEVPNGLALCAIHHKAFDRGSIGLDE
ncbi:ACP phosphodiesterase, partial [Salmonella enterica subsp. enterica serovar Anatum]|nr:ACP phosphodiesterase [Salmonella enterica subsp. enterica serovar Anatum]